MIRAWAPTKVFQAVRLYFERADTLATSSFFVIGTLVYGVFIPSLGFYWDDWPVIWVYNALGSRGIINYFAGNRPVSGWIYAHLAPILGISPIGWQVFTLAVRCASSAVLYIAFRALWPRRKDVAWLVGTLVLLYPGFSQQPIALTYLSQHLSFFFFVVSLATTIFYITTPAYRWLFLAVSLVTGAFSYLITEYFIGLEFFRLFVIGTLISRECITRDLKKLRTALIMWSPYATVWTAYAVWRAFIFREVSHYYGTADNKNVGSDISWILSSPIHEVSARVLAGINNILMATVVAWARPFSQALFTLDSRSVIRSWTIATVVVGITIYILRRLTVSPHRAQTSEPPYDTSRSFPENGLLMGVVGLCVAGLPFVAPELTAGFTTHPSFGDRYTLPFMLGASLTLSGLLAFLGTTRLSRVLVALFALFACSAYQVQNTNLYRHDWLAQKSLFWQVAWRAPALKQGTSVFADGWPRSLIGNHSAGLLNLLYNKDDSAGRLDYFIFDLSQLSTQNLPWGWAKLDYGPGDPVVGLLRSFQFRGTTSQSLVVWISPSGTFRIVTQPYANEFLRGSALSINISYLSQPGEVIRDASGLPDGPLLKIFGPEPKHEWSFFYQKAELERQFKNWDAVATLGDEVIKKGYKPIDPSEWFPFIEGYARAHRYRTAAELSKTVLEQWPDALAALSSLWLRLKNEDSQNSAELSSALGDLEGKLMLRDGQ